VITTKHRPCQKLKYQQKQLSKFIVNSIFDGLIHARVMAVKNLAKLFSPVFGNGKWV
jgi:hypothetical protein